MGAAYEEYLQSPHWLALRRQRCGKKAKCVGCGSKKTLQLHHVSYDNVGHEEPTDLIVVCRPCHMAIHAELDRRFPRLPLAVKVKRTRDIWFDLFTVRQTPNLSKKAKRRNKKIAEAKARLQARRDAKNPCSIKGFRAVEQARKQAVKDAETARKKIDLEIQRQMVAEAKSRRRPDVPFMVQSGQWKNGKPVLKSLERSSF